jgi:hypothetical protein
MYLITLNVCLNARTNLATVRQPSNLGTQQDSAGDAACLTCSRLNLTRDTASRTDEPSERCATKLNTAANAKFQPLRDTPVDARDNLGDESPKLLLALGNWTLNEHTATRALLLTHSLLHISPAVFRA